MPSLSDLIGRSRSASTAKDRLRVVLIHDRSALPPGVMDALRQELIEVVARHIDVDQHAVRVEMVQEGRSATLQAEIPIKGAPKQHTTE
ncbi:MAG: cell division topological specificity factor MinE [Anaerolineales bacterium]|nr:cell division topological specificity factor MinE [Anaerolineales bacterium]